MSTAIALVVQLLHVALMLATAPVLAGGIAWVSARLAGRAGPALTQDWRDLRRLWRKPPVLAESASWLFAAVPAARFAALAAAAALVPSFASGMTTAPLADILVIGGLLALSRCVLALAAMDTGTAQGGLAASRAMGVAALAEPALLLAIFAVALLAGGTNLDAIVVALQAGSPGVRAPLGLAVAVIGVIALAEERAPFADLAREYSGRHLALLVWGGALRRLVWLTLIADVALPFGIAQAIGAPVWWLPGIAAWAVKLTGLGTALAVAATIARPILPRFLGVAMLLGLLAVMATFIGQIS